MPLRRTVMNATNATNAARNQAHQPVSTRITAVGTNNISFAFLLKIACSGTVVIAFNCLRHIRKSQTESCQLLRVRLDVVLLRVAADRINASNTDEIL